MASLTNTHESTIEVLKIPHFDLRSFCQDELYLAAHFSGPSSKARFPDIVIPTIDKRLFNPSIGSRKQTYSRRSRGRPRAEQNFSSSLSLQSRAGIQLSIAKQFKDLTAEILGSTSRRLSSSSTRNAHTVTGSGLYLDEPQNWTIRDLDHVNHKESRGSVLSTAERLAFTGSLSSQSVDPEKSSENESSDGDLSGHTNIPKLVVNSDTKRVEAPSEGEEVTLQQELERASQSVGKEADSGEISAIHRPLKKMRIKEGARKRSVSEIIACQSLPRHHVGSKGNDIMKEASSFVNGKTKRKGSEVLKLPLIELQNNRTEEGARVLLESIVVQGLPQRVESKAHDSVEKARACIEGGNEGKSFEDQQLPAAIELQNDAKERPKEDWKVREKEAVLLECLCKMEGMWLSNEMAKKVVDAKGFPKGWKVTIGLNKKNGRNFFEYRNYKSPDGKLWPSFKEASQYLVSEVKNLPIFSTVHSIGLIHSDQPIEANVKSDGCEASAQIASTSSDDMVLQSLQPSFTKHLQNKKGLFRKVNQGISKPEDAGKISYKEETEAASLMEGDPRVNQCSLLELKLNEEPVCRNEEDSVVPISASEQALLIETPHLVGWNKEGCCFCKMTVDWDKLCVCNWCEREFHVGCVEVASCGVNDQDLLCPSCKAA